MHCNGKIFLLSKIPFMYIRPCSDCRSKMQTKQRTKLMLTTPKSPCSIRVIPIPEDIVNLLKNTIHENKDICLLVRKITVSNQERYRIILNVY